MALTERTTAPVRRGPPGHGPVHSLAETPDGAWAEFIRHEQGAVAPTELMVGCALGAGRSCARRD